jgi:hypothetical protein
MSDTNSGDPAGASGDGGDGRRAGKGPPSGEGPPDPIEDVRKGLGLLFRAARSAIESLPTGRVEDVVLNGAREVGRALENVTQTLDKQFFNRDRSPHNREQDGERDGEPPQPTDRAAAPQPADPTANAKAPTTAHSPPEQPPEQSAEAPKGPRVE